MCEKWRFHKQFHFQHPGGVHSFKELSKEILSNVISWMLGHLQFPGCNSERILGRLASPLTHIQVLVLVQFVLTDTHTHAETALLLPTTPSPLLCMCAHAGSHVHALTLEGSLVCRQRSHTREADTRICFFSREQLLLIQWDIKPRVKRPLGIQLTQPAEEAQFLGIFL